MRERVRDTSAQVRERVRARVSFLHIYTATWCRAKLGRDGLLVGSAILTEAGLKNGGIFIRPASVNRF